MSNEADKLKHSKRRKDTKCVIRKRLKFIRKSNWGVGSRYTTEPHRLSKMNGINCGNPNCFMCMNPRKYGEKTMQERKMNQREIDYDTND